MFYDNLNTVCKANKTTITALLKKLGLSTSNGTLWKNGVYPNSEVVIRFSELLNVSTDYLLTGKEKTTAPELTEAEQKILNICMNVPEDMLNNIIEALGLFVNLTMRDQIKEIGMMERVIAEYTPEEKEKRLG